MLKIFQRMFINKISPIANARKIGGNTCLFGEKFEVLE